MLDALIMRPENTVIFLRPPDGASSWRVDSTTAPPEWEIRSDVVLDAVSPTSTNGRSAPTPPRPCSASPRRTISTFTSTSIVVRSTAGTSADGMGIRRRLCGVGALLAEVIDHHAEMEAGWPSPTTTRPARSMRRWKPSAEVGKPCPGTSPSSTPGPSAWPANLSSTKDIREINSKLMTWQRYAVVVLPGIADYELRREPLRRRATRAIRWLDHLRRSLDFLPIDAQTMDLAAELWAQTRQSGKATADSTALDGDVILAAQVRLFTGHGDNPVVITENNRHLGRFSFLKTSTWKAYTPTPPGTP